MPGRTSATRPKGSGVPAGGMGWGGSAKGEGNRTAGPGRGHTHRTVADLMIAAGCRELAAQRWQDILNDPAHPKHAEMVAKAADRMDGAPTQNIAVRDVDPNTLTDAELAALATGRSGAADRAP